MIGRITAEKCHLCKMNCPQENLAKSCAEGRMYATQEVVRLQKELEVYKAIGTPEECRAAMEKQTACNPDKVVEQLEEHFNATNDKGARLAYHHAIQIVEGGGVDEMEE